MALRSTPRITPFDRLTVSARHPALKWVVMVPAFIVVIMLIQTILPDSISKSQGIGRVILAILGVWMLIVGYGYNAWVSLTSPIVALIFAEFWVLISTVRAQVVFGTEFESYDLTNLFFLYILYYLAGSVLGFLIPKCVQWLRYGLIGVFTLSSLVAVAQGAGIQTALNIARHYQYQATQDITNWDNRSGIRAIGLSPTPAIMGLEAGFALALVFAPYFFRKLKWWEITLSLLFIVAVLASQSRGTYVLMALFGIAAAIATIAKYGRRGVFTVVVALCVFACVIALNLKRLNYALGFDSTYLDNIKYRQQVSWAGGLRAFRYSQIFGIGPDPTIIGGPNHFITKFNIQKGVDNGYIGLLAMFGIPGLILFCASPIMGIISGMRATIDNRLDEGDRSVALSLVAATALLLGIMGVNSGFAYIQLWTLLCFFAGTFAGSVRAKTRLAQLSV